MIKEPIEKVKDLKVGAILYEVVVGFFGNTNISEVKVTKINSSSIYVEDTADDGNGHRSTNRYYKRAKLPLIRADGFGLRYLLTSNANYIKETEALQAKKSDLREYYRALVRGIRELPYEQQVKVKKDLEEVARKRNIKIEKVI